MAHTRTRLVMLASLQHAWYGKWRPNKRPMKHISEPARLELRKSRLFAASLIACTTPLLEKKELIGEFFSADTIGRHITGQNQPRVSSNLLSGPIPTFQHVCQNFSRNLIRCWVAQRSHLKTTRIPPTMVRWWEAEAHSQLETHRNRYEPSFFTFSLEPQLGV